MSEAYWKERYHAAEEAFQKLKSLTKRVPAGTWTDDYRELAEMIHTLGRDVFWVPLCGACGKCEECLKVENGEMEMTPEGWQCRCGYFTKWFLAVLWHYWRCPKYR
jgi:hypothetical protein